MDQNLTLQSIGQRIVKAARLAVELHLAGEHFECLSRQQRDLIGGTDSTVRCTCGDCDHAESSDSHTVTDDVLPCRGL